MYLSDTIHFLLQIRYFEEQRDFNQVKTSSPVYRQVTKVGFKQGAMFRGNLFEAPNWYEVWFWFGCRFAMRAII